MIVLELAESFLPRECSGAERDGWGDDRGLAAKRRKGRKNRIDDGKADAGGRRAEGWPTEHTEHTEEFLTGGNGGRRSRRLQAVRHLIPCGTKLAVLACAHELNLDH